MRASEKVTGLSQELLDLHAQLESMGGGDVRLAPLTVYVRVRPPKDPPQGSCWPCISLDGDVVRLIDPKAAGSASIESAQRSYKVSCALPIHSNQLDMFSVIGNQALDSLWDGFNIAGATSDQSRCDFSNTLLLQL